MTDPVGGPRLGGHGWVGHRSGFTLLEALVVLTLSAFVLSAGWQVFSSCLAAGVRISSAAEGLETVRTVSWLLGEDLHGSTKGWDRWSEGNDSVSLRAYRGMALVEGTETGGGLRVCFRGLRSPNPAKDSILFLSPVWGWHASALRSRVRTAGECRDGGEGWLEIWMVNPEPTEAVFGRVFERGSYHLSDGAFRYRRGRGGRQPLTAERVGPALITVGEGPGDPLDWELVLTHTHLGDTLPWIGRVR